MKKILLLGLSLLILSTSVNASIITGFDDVSSGTFAPFTSNGLDFASNGVGITGAWNTTGTPSDNGTNALIVGFGDSVTITRNGGGLFSVNSFDAGLSWYTALSSLAISVGGEIISLGLGYSTYTFSSLTNISSLTIAAGPSDGYFAIDNIEWTSSDVPIPAPIALIGLGLILISYNQRKKAA
ncbi:MAG: hypothetical protein ABW088_02550 [Sedimenticola sp.]